MKKFIAVVGAVAAFAFGASVNAQCVVGANVAYAQTHVAPSVIFTPAFVYAAPAVVVAQPAVVAAQPAVVATAPAVQIDPPYAAAPVAAVTPAVTAYPAVTALVTPFVNTYASVNHVGFSAVGINRFAVVTNRMAFLGTGGVNVNVGRRFNVGINRFAVVGNTGVNVNVGRGINVNVGRLGGARVNVRQGFFGRFRVRIR